MPVVGADTHETLSGISSGDVTLLDEALGLREAQRERIGLDGRTFALVKIAALIALDAPPASYARRRLRTARPRRTSSRCSGRLLRRSEARRSSRPRLRSWSPSGWPFPTARSRWSECHCFDVVLCFAPRR